MFDTSFRFYACLSPMSLVMHDYTVLPTLAGHVDAHCI